MNNESFIQRKTIAAGQDMTFIFPDASGYEWLIKNMADGSILVAYDADTSDEDCIMIPANTAEVISIRRGHAEIHTGTIVVKPQDDAKSGSVEVRCLKW